MKPKPKKRLWIGLGIGLVVLVILSLFNYTRTGTLEIRAADNNGAKVDIVVSGPDGSQQKLTLRAGNSTRLRLPAGTVSVKGSAGRIQAIDVVTVRSRQTVSLTTPSGEQRAVHKVGSDVEYCPVMAGDRYFSYNCHGDGLVFRHNPLGSNEDSLWFGATTFNFTSPVKNGLLGFTTENSQSNGPYQLVYLDLPSNQQQAVPLPGAVTALMKDKRPELVTSSLPGDSRFALVFRDQDKVFLFKDVGDMSPVQPKLSNKAKLSDSIRLSSFSYAGDTFVVYSWLDSDLLEGESNAIGKIAKKAPAYYFEYAADGTLSRTIAMPDDKNVDTTSAYKLTSNFYVTRQPAGVDFYYYSENTMKYVYRLEDVASFLAVGDKAYVQSGGVLYLFEPQGTDGLFRLHGLFSSSAITVSELFNSPQGVVFTAMVNRSPEQQRDVYQLLNTAQTVKPLEETLDWSKVSPFVNKYDYDDATIWLYPKTIDPGDNGAETTIGKLRAELNKLKVDTGNRQVLLPPGDMSTNP